PYAPLDDTWKSHREPAGESQEKLSGLVGSDETRGRWVDSGRAKTLKVRRRDADPSHVFSGRFPALDTVRREGQTADCQGRKERGRREDTGRRDEGCPRAPRGPEPARRLTSEIGPI